MDYDKLIESLEMHRVIYKNDYDNFSGGACTSDCMDAALAIETLRAENKKLRAGKKKAIENLSKIVKLAHEQRDAVIADLARVTAERDEAISDVEALMWFSGEGCRICAHAVEVHKEPYVRLDCDREKGTDCSPKWRGIKED